MKFIKAIILLLIIVNSVWAQLPVNELKIGDKVPDVQLNHIINYHSTSAKLSDFRGKIMLIDFYATWCIPCIAALPRLDSLQKLFNNQLVILPIAYQKEAVVTESLRHIPSLKNISLPVVVEDTIMQKLFPHHTVPHDVIIDRNGIVKAITSIENINAIMMRNYINGQSVAIELKKDVMHFNFDKPLFINDKGIELLKYQFLITGYYEGIASREGRKWDSNQNVDTRIYATNTPIINLYRTALTHSLLGEYIIPKNRVILNVKDSTPFTTPKLASPNRLGWDRKNLYCMDLTIPPNMGKHLYEILKNGLDDFFNLNTKIEKRKLKCFILKTIDSNKYASKSSKFIFDKGNQLWTFKKYPIADFLKRVNGETNCPVINETAYLGNIDIELSPDFKNVTQLKAQLNNYGLDLVEAIKEMDVIVIEDKN